MSGKESQVNSTTQVFPFFPLRDLDPEDVKVPENTGICIFGIRPLWDQFSEMGNLFVNEV